MKEKLLEIINHYGIEHQQRKLNEEVFELQEAIINRNYLPKEVDPEIFGMNLAIDEATDHIEEEMADVLVMLYQIKHYYSLSNERINEIAKQKVDRQLERIKEEKMIENFTKKDLKVGDRLYFKGGFATLISEDNVIFDKSGTILPKNYFSDDLEYRYNKNYNILRVERFEEITKGKGYQLITSDSMLLNATGELYKSVVVYERPKKKIPLLDEKEKEYLSKVIEPFRDEVKYIVKESCIGEEFIAIEFKNNGYLEFPNFKTNSMYKGMKLYKQYTLEELGL